MTDSVYYNNWSSRGCSWVPPPPRTVGKPALMSAIGPRPKSLRGRSARICGSLKPLRHTREICPS